MIAGAILARQFEFDGWLGARISVTIAVLIYAIESYREKNKSL